MLTAPAFCQILIKFIFDKQNFVDRLKTMKSILSWWRNLITKERYQITIFRLFVVIAFLESVTTFLKSDLSSGVIIVYQNHQDQDCSICAS